MRRLLPQLVSMLVLASPIFAVDGATAKPLVPKQGDVWVMAGDSITAQRLHSNYIEAYYRTRFPGLNLKFRNSGIGGNTTASVLARFGYDVADWKPSIVSVELGMNDVGGGEDPAKYIEGMRQLVKRIQAIPATPVLISSSPVNDGSALNAWQSDRCRKMHPYTEALVHFGQQEGVLVIDQYHPLLSRWSSNKLRADIGRLSVFTPHLKVLGLEESEPGVKEFQALTKAWRGSENARDLGGDAVHPGPVGQFTMAATILSKLGVEKEVSAATLSADGKVTSATGCKITNCQFKDGALTFTRLDESSPWPIPAAGRAALLVMPEIADLSRYGIAVTGLPPGEYHVLMNGTIAAAASDMDLAKGINLATADAGPFATGATEIYNLIGTLQGQLNNQWREASKNKDSAKVAAAQKEIELLEMTLSAACQPKPIQFTVRKAQ